MHILQCSQESRREKLRGELGSCNHISFNLHFALHESNLRVQFALANFLEVSICHSERSIGVLWLTLRDGTLTILEVDLVN